MCLEVRVLDERLLAPGLLSLELRDEARVPRVDVLEARAPDRGLFAVTGIRGRWFSVYQLRGNNTRNTKVGILRGNTFMNAFRTKKRPSSIPARLHSK